MQNIRVQSQVIPQNQPSLEEWKKQFKVSSLHDRFDIKKENPKEKNYVKNIEKSKKVIY